MLRTYVGVYQQQQQKPNPPKTREEHTTAIPPNTVINFDNRRVGSA